MVPEDRENGESRNEKTETYEHNSIILRRYRSSVLSAKEEEQVRRQEEKVIEGEKNNPVFLEVTDSCGFV